MTRQMATPQPIRMPVGNQVKPRSAMARPLAEVEAETRGSLFDTPSLTGCWLLAGQIAAGIVLVVCVVVFAVLVL